ncbi:carbonic anhydrase, partial [Burkholderia pseudomallei]
EAPEHPGEQARLDTMVRENVVAQRANINTHPSVRLALEQGRLTRHGWVYANATGSIAALDGATGRFVAHAGHPRVHATPP